MKNARLSIICLLVMGLASTVLAIPRAAESSGKHYLVSARKLSSWHTGGSYRQLKRAIAIDGLPGVDFGLELKRATFFLGYEVQPWMALYGVAGNVSPSLSPAQGERDSGFEFGGGFWINLVDHDLLDNLSMENRVRVQALGQVTRGEPSYGMYDLAYTEFHGALTLSLVNELDANKQYWPETVSLFVGPVFNYLEGREFTTRHDDYGLIVGTDVQVSRRVSISVMYERYNSSDEALSGSLNVRL